MSNDTGKMDCSGAPTYGTGKMEARVLSDTDRRMLIVTLRVLEDLKRKLKALLDIR